jgi:glycosyltransferase involved in cell wall biosynthesis
MLVFYFENYVTGGGSKYVTDCLSCVLTSGYDVTLLSNRDAITSTEINQFQGTFSSRHITVFERTQSVRRFLGNGRLSMWVSKMLISASPFMLLLNVFVIWRQLGNLRPELLVACNGGYPAAESALAAVMAARLRRIPSMLVIMSEPQPRRNTLPGYERLLDWIVFSSTQSFVLNSEHQGKALVEKRGAPLARICKVYNGISECYPIRIKPPLASSEIVLGVACRLDPMKGLEDLIRALSLLEVHDHVKLRIVGEGGHLELLQRLVKDLGLSQRVIFTGFKSGQELLDEYNRFDIYVFPSHWEGLPYALLEAMRAGLPIISTSVGGIPEAIRNAHEGLLVPPRSPVVLKEAITRLIADPKQAQVLGDAARVRFQTMFSLKKMHADFLAAVIAIKLKHGK